MSLNANESSKAGTLYRDWKAKVELADLTAKLRVVSSALVGIGEAITGELRGGHDRPIVWLKDGNRFSALPAGTTPGKYFELPEATELDKLLKEYRRTLNRTKKLADEVIELVP